MASLRKACSNCTASKRKCVVQLPKCIRCAQRGLDCTYDLEPLSAPIAQPKRSNYLVWNPTSCETPGYCVMKTVTTRSSSIDPAICRPGCSDTMEFFVMGYQSVPDLVRAGKPATFVHPRLQTHGTRNHFDSLEDGRGVGCASFKRLIELDFEALPIREALSALQVLVIHLESSFSQEKISVQNYLNLLIEWTEILLASAQTRMPPAQSPWQAWLFGESVRRTIIMSYALAMGISSYKNGYCAYWLFLESLPFDRRPGLWMGESPQAWIAAAGAKLGEEVGEQLISFHEFAESLDRQGSFRVDTFMALVALVHNGVD
ncbi:hypothetical protein BDV18DRAFT_645 [Aspergillus unguis]